MEKKKEVDERNQQGVEALLAGRVDEALERFIDAFNLADRDPELVAQCLMNIGDWHRRVTKDLKKAREHFDEAALLTKCLVTKSRLCSMRAMAERGLERIRFLKRAIKFAKQGYVEDPDAARKAKLFALHRLCGFVGEEGTAEQKREALQLIEEALPGLAEDDHETARLNYTKALIIAPERPDEAIALLERSAEIQKDEAMDAGPYLIYASKFAQESGRFEKAREFALKAEDYRPNLQTSDSGRKYLVMLDEVKSKLGG